MPSEQLKTFGPETKEEHAIRLIEELAKMLDDGSLTNEGLIHLLATKIPEIKQYLVDYIVDEQPRALNEEDLDPNIFFGK